MKKVILVKLNFIAIFAITFCLFSSCKKETSEPSSSLSFTVDGINYSNGTANWFDESNDFTSIGGSAKSATDKIEISLQVTSSNEGTYTIESRGVNMSLNGGEYNSHNITGCSVTVIIASHKDYVLKGTFEGKVASSNGTYKTITNGKFIAKVVSPSVIDDK